LENGKAFHRENDEKAFEINGVFDSSLYNALFPQLQQQITTPVHQLLVSSAHKTVLQTHPTPSKNIKKLHL
jgi:hypothetical protein